MCGIAGISGFSAEDSSSALKKMLFSIAHRGPDDEGILVDDLLAIGHRRLSIIDVSQLGHQPMGIKNDKVWIVYNGEIYNFQAIRKQLIQKGYHFRSETDTEVLLHGYQEWGIDVLSHLNGMFAFAIYDKLKQCLLVARDRLGIKPLYYSILPDNRLVFASEIRALLASNLIPPKLNEKAISTFLQYQSVPAPNTLIRGIDMLLPGQYILKNRSGITKSKYWNLAVSGDPISNLKEKPTKNIRKLLVSAVEKRMIADVPLGAFLSGGIDSSLIVAIMSRITKQPVKTFTVAFEDHKFQDGHYSKIVADQFKTSHTELKLSFEDVLDQIPEAISAQDHPSGDGINTYLVSKAARKDGLTVALSGLGSDELFAGYAGFQRVYRQQKNQIFWKLVPPGIRKEFGQLIENKASNIKIRKIGQMIQTSGKIAEVYPLTRQFFSPQQSQFILSQNSNYYTIDLYSRLLSDLLANRKKNSDHVISQISNAELRTYMHDVLLRDTDQMSMSNSLEVRVPFLDHQLVEYVLQLPDKYKFKKKQTKALLLETFKDLLPDKVIDRPKQGFIMPFDDWMKGPLQALCQENLNAISNLKMFDQVYINTLWDCFLKGSKAVSWSRIWLLIALGAWCKRNNISW